jgi:hypothetical protein
VPIERSVFIALFENSIVYERKPYTTAVSISTISLDVLVELEGLTTPLTCDFATLYTLKRKVACVSSRTALERLTPSDLRLCDVEVGQGRSYAVSLADFLRTESPSSSCADALCRMHTRQGMRRVWLLLHGAAHSALAVRGWRSA